MFTHQLILYYSYVAARKVLVETYSAIDEKEWDVVRKNGRLAYANLKKHLQELDTRYFFLSSLNFQQNFNFILFLQ